MGKSLKECECTEAEKKKWHKSTCPVCETECKRKKIESFKYIYKCSKCTEFIMDHNIIQYFEDNFYQILKTNLENIKKEKTLDKILKKYRKGISKDLKEHFKKTGVPIEFILHENQATEHKKTIEEIIKEVHSKLSQKT